MGKKLLALGAFFFNLTQQCYGNDPCVNEDLYTEATNAHENLQELGYRVYSNSLSALRIRACDSYSLLQIVGARVPQESRRDTCGIEFEWEDQEAARTGAAELIKKYRFPNEGVFFNGVALCGSIQEPDPFD